MPRRSKLDILMRPVVPLIGGVILLLVGAGVLFFFSNDETDARSIAKRTADAFKQRLGFTPSVSVNGLTVIEQTLPILELASVQENIFREYKWQHTFLGSSKTLVLRGEFVIKSGFDLKEEFALNIDDVQVAPNTSAKKRVTMRLPEAKILSLEMKNYSVVTDENGWWNKITLEDRTNAVNAMQQEARTASEQAGIRTKAMSMIQRQIQDILKDKKAPEAQFIVMTARKQP
ncbi:MAG: DUF4230 domain-containing protein [Candidatus Kapaibacterium sp.]|nr:MAG: DUF4230 domain-containing protein [Candidatus Kapabacteria bacterium]